MRSVANIILLLTPTGQGVELQCKGYHRREMKLTSTSSRRMVVSPAEKAYSSSQKRKGWLCERISYFLLLSLL